MYKQRCTKRKNIDALYNTVTVYQQQEEDTNRRKQIYQFFVQNIIWCLILFVPF